jgi:hypothetical protein
MAMTRERWQRLLTDAELVCEVGAQLGVLKDDTLFSALQIAQTEGADLSPESVSRLQAALNRTVKDIAPITIFDLRQGWRPGNQGRGHTILASSVFAFAIVLMVACAYTTQVYERARIVHSTTVELQKARAPEKAIRLFGSFTRHRNEIEASLKTGEKDYLFDVFTTSLIDLVMLESRLQSYLPQLMDVNNDLSTFLHPWNAFMTLLTGRSPYDALLEREGKEGTYGPQPPASAASQIQASTVNQVNENDSEQRHLLLHNFLAQVRSFTNIMRVQIDPVKVEDYYAYLYQLQIGVLFLGAWILPTLYGMLGAVVFHLRRLLNPLLPDLGWMKIVLRILLGGFAGVVSVWFWTPSSDNITSGPNFATLTAFGIAFLVGSSTDLFFRMLDRLVEHSSQAIGDSKGILRG